MNHLRVLAATASLLGLGACGTHQSVAPVVYGTDPNSSARVYTPSATAARPEPVREAAYQPPVKSAPTADVEPVTLQPVSAIYLSDEERTAQQAAYQPPSRSRTAQGNPRTISVGRGDTVYALGRRYNVSPQEIIDENYLRAPYLLSVGQELRIPSAAPAQVAAAAPVSKAIARDAHYTVRRGDTLYSISRATGASVQVIAQANNLAPPYNISPGQVLLAPGAQIDASARVAQKLDEPSRTKPSNLASLQAAKPEPQQDVASLARKASYTAPSAKDALFSWPVRGNVIANYGAGELGRRNDGINIAAPAGTPVRAAGDGEVVYRGSELNGFGNLLLVKHTDGFVTAYAHNDSMLVKKGDVVRKGQVIAKVGQTGSVSSPQLHFEIRQKLKAVDPVALLESK